MTGSEIKTEASPLSENKLEQLKASQRMKPVFDLITKKEHVEPINDFLTKQKRERSLRRKNEELKEIYKEHKKEKALKVLQD